MTKQEWEKAQAEALQQNMDEFSECLLNSGFATDENKKIFDLKETKGIWRSKYGLNLSEAVQAWDKAHSRQKPKDEKREGEPVQMGSGAYFAGKDWEND